jgi:hypothetical protein
MHARLAPVVVSGPSGSVAVVASRGRAGCRSRTVTPGQHGRARRRSPAGQSRWNSSKARSARSRACSARCWAAARRWWLLSARIDVLLAGVVAGGLDCGDDVLEVGGDLLVISTTRACPFASASPISLLVARSWARCSARKSGAVMNTGQVRQALPCGQLCWSGRPQYLLGSAMVARPRFSFIQAASLSGLPCSRPTVSPWMLTLRARSSVAGRSGRSAMRSGRSSPANRGRAVGRLLEERRH